MKQDLNKMMCLDIYLSGKNSKNFDHKISSNTMEDNCSKLMPVISWDMFSDHYFKKLKASKKCMDLKKIKNFKYRKIYRTKRPINISKIFKIFKTRLRL